MAEIDYSSIKKTIINLSRNTPVALVVGAAGFLGSSLVDKLISKSIQVVGVDNFCSGTKENLNLATKSSFFHLLNQDAQSLQLDIPRLDYIFITAGGKWDIKNILQIFKETKSRLLFSSYVELYSKGDSDSEYEWFKTSEVQIARFAKEHSLNARVLRLGAVYGPRMDLKAGAYEAKDPIIKLIQESLKGELQKEVAMEFSSRALYIEDAVDLAIKCLFSGATAQKIFDGVNTPVKVSEIKQILLDPVWYEEKGFVPSELPPWSTPNLEKTQKFLNWKPRYPLVKSLKQTLKYFKDNESDIRYQKSDVREEEWKEQKKVDIEEFKKEEVKIKRKRNFKWPKITLPLKNIYLLAVILLFVYAFIWPIFAVSFGVLTFKYQLSEAINNLQKGNFDASLSRVAAANVGIVEAQNMFNSLDPLRQTQLFNSLFLMGDNLSDLASFSSDAAKNTILGIQDLQQSLKEITGESSLSAKDSIERSEVYLSYADSDLSKIEALVRSKDFSSSVPWVLKGSVDSLTRKIADYSSLIKKSRTITAILPGLIALDGQKSYLILVENNMELRPAGGFIVSFAKVSFEKGKLKALKVDDIYNLDKNLSFNVEPPQELKADVGLNSWYLKDSNWEADFPTTARQAEWFYNKETGEAVQGVIGLTSLGLSDLLAVLGPIQLADINEQVTADNFFEKSLSHAELSFFSGSQTKKNFLTSVAEQIFNKLFFVSKQNWPGIVTSLNKSLEQKQLSLYFDDPKLFSAVSSQDWTSIMPRQASGTGDGLQDFLANVEANVGTNKANYFVDRSYSLETNFGKDGAVAQRLRISFTNKSPSNTFPAGVYKNRLRVYLPFGAKLNRALYSESDITRDVKSFVDYGRSGYSVLLELKSREQKTLILDYQLPDKLRFKDGVAKYHLDIIKQAGVAKDSFVWNINYPLNYQMTKGEKEIKTDLSSDRSFEVEFRK